MARIIFALSFFFFIVLLLASVIFVLRNDALVNVDFIFVSFSSLSIGFWVLSSLVLGLLLGLFISLPAQLFLRGSKKVKEQQLQTTKTELSRLKRASSKGN